MHLNEFHIYYFMPYCMIFQESQYALEEIHKQKTSFQSRINDRESEIEKLRSQVSENRGALY